MQSYLKYIFETFIIKPSLSQTKQQFKSLNALNEIKQQLLQLKPVDLTAYYKQLTTPSVMQIKKSSQPSSLIFDQLNLLLAKGVIKYSPSNCTIELSLSNVMIYQRLFKLQKFAQKYLDKNASQFISTWIQQALQQGSGFPVVYNKKYLQKIFSLNSAQQQDNNDHQNESKKKSKSKGKISVQSTKQKTQNKQLYNYHKLIYEYKSQQKQKIQPQSKQDNKPMHNSTKKGQKQNVNKQSNPQEVATNQEFMLNVEQLTLLLQISKCLQLINSRVKDKSKQKQYSLFQFINLKERQSLIHEIRYQKIQEYIAQVLDQDCLLVFNFVKKYPYITQKQLISLTLMDVSQTRAAINKLIQKGYMYFYHENARTIVYKIADQNILQKNYIDMISRSILNLSLAGQKLSDNTLRISGQKIKNKLIQFENQIQRLDDLLLIFGL